VYIIILYTAVRKPDVKSPLPWKHVVGGSGEEPMHNSLKLTETYVRYNRRKYRSCRTHFVEFVLVVVKASRWPRRPL